jgi:hypothetical protein
MTIGTNGSYLKKRVVKIIIVYFTLPIFNHLLGAYPGSITCPLDALYPHARFSPLGLLG